MRFLLAKNVSSRPDSELEAAGHDAVHVDDLGMADADDVDILRRLTLEPTFGRLGGESTWHREWESPGGVDGCP